MNKEIIINWNDVKDRAPLPHYVKEGSELCLIEDDGGFQILGTCLFPKEDPTLSSRSKVNHFHSIILLGNVDVVFALNIAWNTARAVAPKIGWKNMVSVETHTRVFHPIKIDQPYPFIVFLEPMKGNFKKVRLEILDVDNKTKLISVETKVNVSTE